MWMNPQVAAAHAIPDDVKLSKLFQSLAFYTVTTCLSKSIAYPFETVQIIQQTQEKNSESRSKYKGTFDILDHIIQEQGVLRLWRGNTMFLTRFLPSRAASEATRKVYKNFYKIGPRSLSLDFLLPTILTGGIGLALVYPIDTCLLYTSPSPRDS
eukprot:TRINITY_DN11723_c0_g1_i2.p1 TRINITY_DN11723_c0_g1~~TRINITY_DN11723_c0_g1_i2.p1  ORF type:complete len:155 (+),score=29.89 TRINITY_DN11723_c0_g1_i2:50-514(+)